LSEESVVWVQLEVIPIEHVPEIVIELLPLLVSQLKSLLLLNLLSQLQYFFVLHIDQVLDIINLIFLVLK